MDRTLLVATTQGQSGCGIGGNERVLRIPQSYGIIEPSPSDSLASYQGNSFGEDLTPRQKCNYCILQPRLTGQLRIYGILLLVKKLWEEFYQNNCHDLVK